MTAAETLQVGGALVGSGVLARVLWWKPDREVKLNEMANNLIEQLQDNVTALTERVDHLQADNDTLRALVNELRALPTRCVACPLWAAHTAAPIPPRT